MKTSKALLTFDVVTLMPEMFLAISDYGVLEEHLRKNC